MCILIASLNFTCQKRRRKICRSRREMWIRIYKNPLKIFKHFNLGLLLSTTITFCTKNGLEQYLQGLEEARTTTPSFNLLYQRWWRWTCWSNRWCTKSKSTCTWCKASAQNLVKLHLKGASFKPIQQCALFISKYPKYYFYFIHCTQLLRKC